jgi:hypothetical protein
LQESVSLQQRKVAELLRAYQRTASASQAVPDAASSAGDGGGAAVADSSGSGSSSSSGGGAPVPVAGAVPTAAAAAAAGSGGARGGGGSFGGPIAASWPDAGGAAGSGGAGMPPGGGLYVPEGSSLAAAAAAAGVGSGGGASPTVYALLLETVLALATDPSPRVARLGRRVLALAQMELAPLAGVPAPPPPRSASAAPGVGLSPGSSLGGSGVYSQSAGAAGSGLASAGGNLGSGMGASLGSLTSKLVKGGRSWRSGFAAAGAGGGGSSGLGGAPGGGGGGGPAGAPGGAGGGGPGAGGAGYRGASGAMGSGALSSASSAQPAGSASPPGSPSARDAAAAAAAAQVQAFARQQYVLRSTVPEGGQQQQGGYGEPDVGGGGGLSRASSGGGAGPVSLADAAAAGTRGSLPSSWVYAGACDYFSRPMLEPQAGAWRELEAHRVAPWTALQDGSRKAQRLREMEAARARCRGATNPRLREQVRQRAGAEGDAGRCARGCCPSAAHWWCNRSTSPERLCPSPSPSPPPPKGELHRDGRRGAVVAGVPLLPPTAGHRRHARLRARAERRRRQHAQHLPRHQRCQGGVVLGAAGLGGIAAAVGAVPPGARGIMLCC